jgi:hypothetical protein
MYISKVCYRMVDLFADVAAAYVARGFRCMLAAARL